MGNLKIWPKIFWKLYEKMVIFEGRFWACCFSVTSRFYWLKRCISSSWLDCANKIGALLRSNMLKIAILKSQNRACATTHKAFLGTFEGRFWACCFSISPRFYWRNQEISNSWIFRANKIGALLRGNRLKIGPRNRLFSDVAVFGFLDFRSDF